MHLDKKREEQLEKMEFELEKEYNQESSEEQESPEMIFETETENEKEEFIMIHKEAENLEEKEWERIFELLKNMRGWWD